MSKKLAGKKYAGSHSTVIDAAFDIIVKIERMSVVTKISLGIIRQCKKSRGLREIKIKEIPAGLELTFLGNTCAQTIYLYLKNPSENRREITELLCI